MRMRLFSLVCALLLSVAAHAAIEVYDFETPEQETQFQELSNTLRCPKCQNNSIADSNAALAQDLRHKVYEMTKQGKSKQDIVDYMTARYGDFITYNPPFTLSTAILWLGPLFVVVFGFGFIVIRSRKSKVAHPESEQWDGDKEARLKALLESNNQQQETKK
ncbi:cytochrome c-type biogenesis protein CcmH [Vibrio xiamenensis]|uniref:Cytochrome c-type biogenesis protein n=1 Tax=Vibrio xiamenensis TaxID=861298 RepID=A0A1G8ELE2_9VIBR|nr:cytochrome c-type biogenesis protein [Vibrio xiamenensis]SDH70725.1 cytochrome c-type biogenesis protein CcmH [Vibrio xiamenensis]